METDITTQQQRLADGSISYTGGYSQGQKGRVRQLLAITKQVAENYDGRITAATGKAGKAWAMGCLDGLADGGHEDLLTKDQMRRAHEWLDSEPD